MSITQNNVYVHSNPPKAITGSGAAIRQWVRTGDIEKLEKMVLEGQGARLLGLVESAHDGKVKSFLRSIPGYMAKVDLIHDAVIRGSLRETQALIDKKKLATARDAVGRGIGHKAVIYNNKSILEWLAKKHQEILNLKDNEGRTCLHYSAASRDPDEMYDLLMNLGSNPDIIDMHGRKASYYVAHPEELDIEGPTTRSLSRGKRRSRISPISPPKRKIIVSPPSITRAQIRIWIHEKDIGKLERIVWSGHGDKLLLETTNNSKVRRFLENVPHLLSRIKSIHGAAINNDLESLKDTRTKTELKEIFKAKDLHGLTPLHKAAGLGNRGIIEFYLYEIPDAVNEVDNEGRMPLHYAARDPNVYSFMLRDGADENVVDQKGKTPAYYKLHPMELDTRHLRNVPDAPRVSGDLSGWDRASPTLVVGGKRRTSSGEFSNEVTTGKYEITNVELNAGDLRVEEIDFASDPPKTLSRKVSRQDLNDDVGSKTVSRAGSKNDLGVNNKPLSRSSSRGSKTVSRASSKTAVAAYVAPGGMSARESMTLDDEFFDDAPNEVFEEPELGEVEVNGEEPMEAEMLEDQAPPPDLAAADMEFETEVDQVYQVPEQVDVEPELTPSDEPTITMEEQLELRPDTTASIVTTMLEAEKENTEAVVVEAATEAEPETVAKADGEPVLTAEPDGNPEPTAEPDGEPELTAEPDAETEPTAEPDGEPEPTADADGEPEPSAVPDEPEPTADADDEPEPTAVPDEPEPTADVDYEPEPTAVPEDDPEPTAVPDDEPEVIAEPDAEPELTAEADAEPTQMSNTDEPEDVEVVEAPDEAASEAMIIGAIVESADVETEGSRPSNVDDTEGVTEFDDYPMVEEVGEPEVIKTSKVVPIDDEEIDDVESALKRGDMEALVTKILDGKGAELLNRTTENVDVQEFLTNVPAYMAKISNIHVAASNGNLRDLQSLLDRKRLALARDSLGRGPLHLAVLNNHPTVARHLASAYPQSLTLLDAKGRSALHYAATLPDSGSMYKYLVNLGADCNIRDIDDNTPGIYLRNRDLLTHKELAEEGGKLATLEPSPPVERWERPKTPSVSTLATLETFYNTTLMQRESLWTKAWRRLTHQTESSFKALVRKYLDKSTFDLIKVRGMTDGSSLLDVVKFYPQFFIIAPGEEAYDVYQELFVPAIVDHNRIDGEFQGKTSVLGETLPEFTIPQVDIPSKFVTQVRIRVSRNIQPYPFVPQMKKEDLIRVANLLKTVQLNWPCFDLESLEKEVLDELKQKCWMPEATKISRLWPKQRYFSLSDDGNVQVWMNAEDHLDLVVTSKYGKLYPMFQTMNDVYTMFSQNFSFYENPQFGFLTVDPFRVGTGLKITFRIRLPSLMREPDWLGTLCSLHNLSIRWKQNRIENAEIEPNDWIELENNTSLGKNELEIALDITNSVNLLIKAEEEKARILMLTEKENKK